MQSTVLLMLSCICCMSFEEKGYGGTGVIVEESSTDHVNTTIKKESDDENYSAKLVKRKHNSHVHREGGIADKAYYTYYSYHPSSRHSSWSFHMFQHGVPKTWSETKGSEF